MKAKYVITLEIETDEQVKFSALPEIIKKEINEGCVKILAAETAEHYEAEAQDE